MLYENMLPGIMGKVEGCPEAEAIDALRNACMEFCDRTRVLTFGSTVTVSSATVPEVVQFELQVLDIIEARIGGRPILVTYTNDPAVLELGLNEYAITFVDPSYVELTPSPTQPVQLELLLAVAPGPASTEVDDLVWLRHSEALKHGAFARLFAMPGKAWTNAALVDWHEGKFRSAIARAASRNARNRRQHGRRLRVKPA